MSVIINYYTYNHCNNVIIILPWKKSDNKKYINAGIIISASVRIACILV